MMKRLNLQNEAEINIFINKGTIVQTLKGLYCYLLNLVWYTNLSLLTEPVFTKWSPT